MTNLITFAVLVLIVGGAGLYIYKAKKSGVKCIGCPSGATCGKAGESGCCGGCSGCSGHCGAK